MSRIIDALMDSSEQLAMFQSLQKYGPVQTQDSANGFQTYYYPYPDDAHLFYVPWLEPPGSPIAMSAPLRPGDEVASSRFSGCYMAVFDYAVGETITRRAAHIQTSRQGSAADNVDIWNAAVRSGLVRNAAIFRPQTPPEWEIKSYAVVTEDGACFNMMMKNLLPEFIYRITPQTASDILKDATDAAHSTGYQQIYRMTESSGGCCVVQ